ncbi:hypothetical protein Salat_2441600 [Sesamum alatum]|uniref:Uncharacterized protein n=1 Tax=Sesamum alatum TaxID=300844 RepID=A0AAE1XY80_9LAMI|nr:hypothetical protein Salat_2441600 [Sesamum alatum]
MTQATMIFRELMSQPQAPPRFPRDQKRLENRIKRLKKDLAQEKKAKEEAVTKLHQVENELKLLNKQVYLESAWESHMAAYKKYPAFKEELAHKDAPFYVNGFSIYLRQFES